ncbi:MAG: hypothetical protein ACXVA9_02860 [Bdellovibrionales bacterium]
MRKTIFMVLLVVLSPTSHALIPAACTDCSSDAAAFAKNLEGLGFNCSFGPVSVSRGYRCQKKIGAYSQPVDVFIAPGFQKIRAYALAYYLHGFLTVPGETPFDGVNGDFGSFLAASKKNMILIIPESKGKDATYASDLNTPAKMNQFFQQTEAWIVKAGVPVAMNTVRLLSSHSGGYVQLALMGDWAKSGAVPYLKSVAGIALFDSPYGYRTGFANFMDVMCANPSADYYMAFNPADGSTGKRDTYARILNELKTSHNCPHAQVIYDPDSHTQHAQFPSKYMSSFFAGVNY